MANKLTIIIPAAGCGRRMKGYGPKSLLSLHATGIGKSILSQQIAVCRKVFGDPDIVVVTGFDAARIIQTIPSGVRVVENEAWQTTHAARSVELGLLASNCQAALIILGDLVLNEKALTYPLPMVSSVFVEQQKSHFKREKVGCVISANQVTHFAYGLPVKWGQILLLQEPELMLYRKLMTSEHRRKKLLFEVLNDILEANGQFQAVALPEMHVIEVDTFQDLDIAKKV